jgi:tRNA-guanine family transglycosylase
MLAHRMLTLHNLTFYQTLMREARSAIERSAFDAFASAFKARYRERAV